MTDDNRAGLSAREALEVLTPKKQDELIRSDIQLQASGATWVDLKYDDKLGISPDPQRPLLDRLADGTWHAKGMIMPIKPSSRNKHIPAHLWAVLSLDPDSNTASGGGLEYCGLLFYNGEAEHQKSSALPEKHCHEWLIEEFAAQRDRTKKDCKTEAIAKFKGLSGLAFFRAWKSAKEKKTTHSSWHKSGPVDSS